MLGHFVCQSCNPALARGSGRSGWRGLALGPEAATSWLARPSGAHGCTFARAPGQARPGPAGEAGVRLVAGSEDQPVSVPASFHHQERQGGGLDVRSPPSLEPWSGLWAKKAASRAWSPPGAATPTPTALGPRDHESGGRRRSSRATGSPGLSSERWPMPCAPAFASAGRARPTACHSVGDLATRPRAASSRAREPWARGPLVAVVDRNLGVPRRGPESCLSAPPGTPAAPHSVRTPNNPAWGAARRGGPGAAPVCALQPPKAQISEFPSFICYARGSGWRTETRRTCQSFR